VFWRRLHYWKTSLHSEPALLFMRHPDELDETQHHELALIRQASGSRRGCLPLGTSVYADDPRADRTPTGCLAQLGRSEPFVRGIQQDKAAVLAGLTLPWSNGPRDRHVKRLKLLKRMMYGRAEFPLLRQRVLHAI
jgi:hypothetical protein